MGDGWDERNWDAVRRQEQKKQEVLVQASKNSERIRKMVRQVEETKTIGAETLGELDKQSGMNHGSKKISKNLYGVIYGLKTHPIFSNFVGSWNSSFQNEKKFDLPLCRATETSAWRSGQNRQQLERCRPNHQGYGECLGFNQEYVVERNEYFKAAIGNGSSKAGSCNRTAPIIQNHAARNRRCRTRASGSEGCQGVWRRLARKTKETRRPARRGPRSHLASRERVKDNEHGYGLYSRCSDQIYRKAFRSNGCC
mmetsp:Transcript_36814/g.76878  ORF Transcript_36814/g.76878 Transcript_36814/m.76878 type:complete len:254 (+) Transcript_36814:30-791(+)